MSNTRYEDQSKGIGKTGIYIQLLERMVVDGLVLPIGSIHSIVDVYSDKPVILVNNCKHVAFSALRYLSPAECRLYMTDIILLRACKVYSTNGDYKILFEAGEKLFVDGFTETGEAYSIIDEHEYEIDDAYYAQLSNFNRMFRMQYAQYATYIAPINLSEEL